MKTACIKLMFMKCFVNLGRQWLCLCLHQPSCQWTGWPFADWWYRKWPLSNGHPLFWHTHRGLVILGWPQQAKILCLWQAYLHGGIKTMNEWLLTLLLKYMTSSTCWFFLIINWKFPISYLFSIIYSLNLYILLIFLIYILSFSRICQTKLLPLQGHLYIFGGQNSQDEYQSSVERLDMSTQTWSLAEDMIVGRNDIAVTLIPRHLVEDWALRMGNSTRAEGDDNIWTAGWNNGHWWNFICTE